MSKKNKSKYITLSCSVCKSENYTTTKNSENVKGKLTLSKFCKNCRKHTAHKESK